MITVEIRLPDLPADQAGELLARIWDAAWSFGAAPYALQILDVGELCELTPAGERLLEETVEGPLPVPPWLIVGWVGSMIHLSRQGTCKTLCGWIFGEVWPRSQIRGELEEIRGKATCSKCLLEAPSQ